MASFKNKENKYKSDMINSMTSDIFKVRKNFYSNFYLLITSNSNLGYSDLIKKLEEKFGVKFTREDILAKLKEMKLTYSAGKAEEVCTIINIAIYKDKGNKEKLMLYEAKLKMINDKKASVKSLESRRKKDPYNGNFDNKDRHDFIFDEANELMDRVINGEKFESSEVSKKLQFIKRYLKEFDQEKYVDFIIKQFQIETISIEEIKQLLEVVTYFKDNLNKNLLIFKNADPEDKERIEELSKMHVAGEEELDPTLVEYPRKLFAWKKNRIEKEYIFFDKYGKMLEKIINDEDINLKDYYNSADKRIMLEENGFILDYYNSIRNYFDANLFHIKGAKTINQADYEKLEKNYKKKVIKK